MFQFETHIVYIDRRVKSFISLPKNLPSPNFILKKETLDRHISSAV